MSYTTIEPTVEDGVQYVSYMEDATQFPHGPFVVCGPLVAGDYRVEQACSSGVGTHLPLNNAALFRGKRSEVAARVRKLNAEAIHVYSW